MSISSADVKKIAKLAMIKVSDEDVETYQKELSKIMGWVEQLNEINTENVEPLLSVIDRNIMTREDVVKQSATQSEILENAPISKYGCFVVPKVVE